MNLKFSELIRLLTNFFFQNTLFFQIKKNSTNIFETRFLFQVSFATRRDLLPSVAPNQLLIEAIEFEWQ